ncbi:hypothetical protein KY285_018204 [Solanum tuberosum]|nr:hypothetical protein KY284_018194 [Solanum tuberosum]KAH0703926.1 hypothetical protein KY285_018204 [Solanum tuberosum]
MENGGKVQHVTKASSDQLLRKFAEMDSELEVKKELRLSKRRKRTLQTKVDTTNHVFGERKSLLPPAVSQRSVALIVKARLRARNLNNRSFFGTIEKTWRRTVQGASKNIMLVKFHPPVELMYLKPNLSMFPDAQKENYGNMAVQQKPQESIMDLIILLIVILALSCKPITIISGSVTNHRYSTTNSYTNAALSARKVVFPPPTQLGKYTSTDNSNDDDLICKTCKRLSEHRSTVAPVASSVSLEQDAAVGSVWTSRKTTEIVASVIMYALLVRNVHLAFVSMPN